MVPLLRKIESARLDMLGRQVTSIVLGRVKGKIVRRGKKLVEVPPPGPQVAALQLSAVEKLVGISKRRAALLGFDAPTKVTPTEPTGDMSYLSWTEEELDRKIAEKEKELGLEPVIDVETERQGDEN